MNWEETVIRLLVASILGALVGFERQLHQRTAGLRTNMLVALGSAGFTLFGAIYVEGESIPRIVAQIVSGIGFLGAGAIMREGFNIHGLNTAATIWCSAAVGIFCGAGFHLSATIFTFFIVVINTILRNVENYMEKHPVSSHDTEVNYVIEIICSPNHNRDIRETLLKRMRHRHFFLKQMQVKNMDNSSVLLEAIFRTRGTRDQSLEQVVEDLSMDPDIRSIEWHVFHHFEKQGS